MERTRYRATQGQLGRAIVARLLPGSDLMEGTRKICEDYDIQNAFFVCSIGSLQKAVFMVAGRKADAKMGVGYTSPKEIPGPVELLGGQGWIGEDEKGERLLHFHGMVSDSSGKTYGGHLIEGENRSLLTIDLVVVELKGARLIRKYDKEVGLIELDFL